MASERLHRLATCLLFSSGVTSATTANVSSRAGKHAKSLAVLRTSRSPSPVQPPLKLVETVSLRGLKSHFHRNVRGAPCNTIVAILHAPCAYRNAHGGILFVDRAVTISRGHPCYAMTLPPTLPAKVQFSPISCDTGHATAARPSTGVDARVVYSIGVRCFTKYFWHQSLPRSHQRRRCAALAPSSPPCSLWPVLNVVRAYIHCNHLQYAPTTRASAPAAIATLTGAANPP